MAYSRPSRPAVCTLCLWAACAGSPARAATAHSTHAAPARVAPVPSWEGAQASREAFEALPPSARTRAAYTRVIAQFRAIYYTNPADTHSAASIFAVAELLAEEGRSLHDRRAIEAAAGQYRFLRTQYPANILVPVALLAEAQVEQNDLHDLRAARERYTLLIDSHPQSEQAGTARAALEDSGGPAPKAAAADPPPTPADPATPPKHGGSLPAMLTTGEYTTPARDTVPASAQPKTSSLPVAADKPPAVAPATSPTHQHTALVSGIRHWSTHDYTRVAIDLGDEVTFEAARVPAPDRIFFDLHSTRLAPELVGKSFSVTDDGFLKRIRAGQSAGDTTRVVLDVSEVTEYSAFLLPNPYRLIIDIHGKGKGEPGSQNMELSSAAGSSVAANQPPASPTPAQAELLLPHPPPPAPAPRVAQAQNPTTSKPVPNTVTTKSAATTREVAEISRQPGMVEATGKPTSQPIAAVVPDSGKPDKSDKTRFAADKHKAPGEPARAASPTAAGETSLVRALGLKIGRIVIDAGHGGHDSGTIGAGGIQEKDVVLDVALRLGKLLHDRLGAKIIYTRSDDTFIPLEDRTAIANKAQADLFLSIHANSSPDAHARGVETYYLNFTSQADALQVAARENAVSGSSIHELSDLVKKIALKDKIEESREFASDVEQNLYGGLAAGNSGLKNRGVKKAPFVVLIGANMPSILAEISFVTNERDAAALRRPEYRQRVAQSLFKGVAKYEAGLGETQLPVERASRE